MPSSLSKSLVRAIPLAAKSAPNVEITNGLERLLIDLTEAYDYQLYSINVENNNVHLAMEVAMDPTTKLAQILYQSCDEKETPNMPLRKVSPTDNELLFGFGYTCLDFIEVLDKEYDYFNSLHALQENIQEAPSNDPMATMFDFPRKDIIRSMAIYLVSIPLVTSEI